MGSWSSTACVPCVSRPKEAPEVARKVSSGSVKLKASSPNSSTAVIYAIASGRSFPGVTRSFSSVSSRTSGLADGGVPQDIARINARYAESVEELAPMSSPLASDKLCDGSEYSCRLQGEVFHANFSKTFDGDPVKALAMLCEMDLCHSWMPNVTAVEALETSNYPLDSLWYVRQVNDMGGLEDMVLHVSFVDALNEPMQALWFCIYTPPGDAEDCRGVKFPPPDPEYSRLDMHTVYCIKPTGNDQFTLTLCACVHLPSVALKALSWIPTFALKRQVKNGMEDKFNPFKKTLEASGEVDARFQGDRKHFYSQIKRHVQDSEFVPAYERRALKCGM